MEQISHCLKSSEGQSGKDGVSEGPDEAHSDSGDSIFITQLPVPAAVRRKRQRAQDSQSEFSSSGGTAFYEDETSPSNSNTEHSSYKQKKKKEKKRPPTYRFSFLNKTEGQGSVALTPLQNKRLHNYAMRGFFNCVELLERERRGENQMSSLPTVDMDRDCITPISEEEDKEDRLEDGDFKIVGRKQFAVPLKPKISRRSCNPRKNEGRQQTSTSSTAGWASKEKQRSTIWKVRRITLSSDSESSDDGEVLAPTGTPRKKKFLKIGKKNINFNEKEKADEVGSDSDPTLCGSSLDEYMEKVKEAAVAEPHADVSQRGDAECEPERPNLPRGDANNGALCSQTRVKKKGKKDYESILERSPGEAEGQRAAPSVKAAVAEGDEAPHVSQTADELESQRKEKSVEVDAAVSFNEEKKNKKKKKKKKEKNMNDNVDIETEMANEPQYNDGKSINKTTDLPPPTTGHVEDLEDCLENPETALETLEFTSVKRKKHKKKKKRSSFKDNTEVGEDVCVDVDCSSDVITVTGSTDLLAEKQSISERVQVSYTPGEEETVDNTPKKTEALEEQDADLANEKKKKKKEKNMNDNVDIETGMANEPQYNDGKSMNKTTDLPPPTTGHVEDLEDCLENPETALETLEFTSVKRKKPKKKKKRSSFKDNTEVGEDICVDVDCSSDVITVTGSTDLLAKKQSVSERVQVSYTPGEEETVDNTPKKTEALEEQDADLATEKKKKKKKKKKKMKELSDTTVSEATASQSDCLASAQTKYKRKTSSFLVADEEEKAGQTHGDKHACHGDGAETPDVSIRHLTTTSTDVAAGLEESGLQKKKRSAVWDSVERETGFEEPQKTSPGALPEPGIAEKKKHKRNKRKKEKKKQKAAPEDTKSEDSTLNTCSSLSPKKKRKHGRSSETLIYSILSEGQATAETLFEHTLPSSSTLGLGDARVKKKKESGDNGDEHLAPLKSLTETTDTAVYETKKEKRKKQGADCSFISAVPDTPVTQLETSSSHTVRKNKVKKAKRALYNPSEELFSD
ncbi:uncharacterized protein LOC133459784 [Cololabis saira]|uniref:uncharacterized protein LOC133459784 n=1 Tax=Cololabis saira TaxID=129043 RepID=UPI002AD4B843|nr:uncharacterized protein LOC133459784 [Cololabis saira]